MSRRVHRELCYSNDASRTATSYLTPNQNSELEIKLKELQISPYSPLCNCPSQCCASLKITVHHSGFDASRLLRSKPRVFTQKGHHIPGPKRPHLINSQFLRHGVNSISEFSTVALSYYILETGHVRSDAEHNGFGMLEAL